MNATTTATVENVVKEIRTLEGYHDAHYMGMDFGDRRRLGYRVVRLRARLAKMNGNIEVRRYFVSEATRHAGRRLFPRYPN